MQILLANAKIMNDHSEVGPLTMPKFQAVANELAADMAMLDIDTLAKELDCSRALAAENWRRYQNFHVAEKLPAIMAYNGQAYKHLKAKTLSTNALTFGQEHLWITCFLYGMLRPMDAIVPYRMEHCVKLAMTEDKPINTFWKNKLTDVLIDSVKSDDGILVHLSTEEYEHLFDWKRVCEEVKVIHPLFYVRQKDGGLKMQAVWAKSCRGAMVRFMLSNQITNPEELKAFSYEGFEPTNEARAELSLLKLCLARRRKTESQYNPNLGEELYPHFVREL